MIKSTGNVIEMNTQSQVVRPLKVLIPLIKEDVAKGDEASRLAGMPYYKAAGEKLIEAQSQISSGFYDWVERNLGFKKSRASLYIAYARATASRQKFGATNYTSLRDFEDSTGRASRPTSGAVHREWREDVDKLAERARLAEARIKEEHLTREQEREAKRKLAERLIDIGYKVLAKELHPDKGGSKDAIQRLHEVRAELKGHRFN